MAEEEASGICLSTQITIILADLSDVTMLEFWSLLKPCSFQWKTWTVSCNLFYQFQVLAQKRLHIPHFLAPWQAAVNVLLEKFARTRVGNKDPGLQILGICILIAASDHGGDHRGRQLFCTPHTHPLLQAPPSPPETISREFKQLVSFFHTSFFPHFRNPTLKTRTFKSNCIHT